MLVLVTIGFFLCIAGLIVAFSPLVVEQRPTLKFTDLAQKPKVATKARKKKTDPLFFVAFFAIILRPFIGGELRKKLLKNLAIAQSTMTPEVFMLMKIVSIVGLLFVLPGFFGSDQMFFGILMSIVVGYMGPEVILNTKIKKIKDELVSNLPDTVDLLGLCVNAGLDFMMALKWVVEKSANNVLTREMDGILQEISVGKPRRDALRDLARKYEIPDLSTFSRTLIQADKMGTSVSDALNILSEDMRLARYRRGEAMALKAPMKMLVPLLVCIFPVVFILIGAPIFLDFVNNNPMKNL